MMEGDLLEVSLDETQHIWKILQACQSNMSTENLLNLSVSILNSKGNIDTARSHLSRLNGHGEYLDKQKTQ